MKHKILDLKKKVLVLEVPEKATLVADNDSLAVYLDEKELLKLNGIFQFICKGSELTEELASGIVDAKCVNKSCEDGVIYNNDNLGSVCIDCFIINTELFKKAIKEKGFYWIRHDVEKPEITVDSNCFELIAKHKDWQQAEEKTFRNCLIFEIL